ncbi:CRISPR-associated endoribonuclease Cas6 [Thermococcus henrietii]|uniref:CRISPR-associated endoribonuclease Cas6 n=1 Tax=Thermococcus henrietii TaxID=2016361 RepID=UPI000C06BFB8|nr:CRISPR-associated endoribonuclease Cas6 [Thermococcus henrietii]
MRLKLTLEIENGFSRPNKHAVQGFIYNMLKDTPYSQRHDEPRFKFFTFSDFFTDREGRINLLVSSPDADFIKALAEKLNERGKAYIGKNELKIVEVKRFRLPLREAFQTGSPVVLYKNALRNEYFKLHAHRDLRFFLERLKENAEKKYLAFYGEEFHIEGPLFDRVIPKLRRNGKLDVYVKVVKNGRPFPVIGSNWELLERMRIPRGERKFYRFIMDAGLGEKNSLGFGFLNPIRR